MPELPSSTGALRAWYASPEVSRDGPGEADDVAAADNLAAGSPACAVAGDVDYAATGPAGRPAATPGNAAALLTWYAAPTASPGYPAEASAVDVADMAATPSGSPSMAHSSPVPL
jgi:hypothetical protein